MPVKSEPEENAFPPSAVEQSSQNDTRRQSAASALLAQLLGNQSSMPSDGPGPSAEHSVPAAQDTNRPQDIDDGMDGQWSTDAPAGTTAMSSDPTGGQDHNSNELPESQQEQKNSDQPPESGLDHSDLFTPFDITGAAKDPFEALQQNEMLTAAYLSQGADLSALGYSGGHLQDTGSIAGSEARIQAFAKLEFDDGHFYCNTYSFILGRDVRAARAAHQRELQVRQVMRHSRAKSSSGGNTSHTPIRMKHEGSGIIGSVVSDRGGIMGFDPDVPPHLPSRISRRSSNSSHAELGAPMHATPAQLQSNTTDYNALAMESLNDEGGDAKPVDALALLPSPDSCPTIPIHPPATTDGSAAGHRGISRKHVKIAYNFDKNLFEMEVMGRNGAFIGADWLSPGQIRPLHSGDYIQIGGVRIRFLLPDVPIGETGADRVEEPYVAEEENAQASVPATENDEDEKRRKSESTENKDAPKTTKIILKTKEPDSSRPRPGTPPKDGIMSKRERAELAREQKLAAKREANGGVTPPPANRPKAGKTTTTSTVVTTPKESTAGDSPGSKPEKRKYTKRKKPDGTLMDFPLPSTEAPPVKKRKPSRSPSPNYPPESAYTPEDLAKPPYNYAVLIFDALTEAGTPMTLKQIYRALKLKYPYFRFKCETEGWTSSVRHNLNGNSHLFMHAERDGKGWSWQLRPGASVEKEKKRRPSPPPPSQPPPMPAAPQYMPPMNPAYSNPTNGQTNMANPHFQFPSMPSNPYPAPSPAPTPTPAPQQSSPYPPPSQPAASTPFPHTKSTKEQPPACFCSDNAQSQQQQTMQAQPQHHSPYPPANPPPPPPPPMSMNPPSQNLPPNPGPPMQHQPNLGVAPGEPSSGPMDTSETSSFNDRANKAIDDFEAVLMEDYEDKNYIREVLKSARARVLGEATESSFPGGEPKDEAVILDALRGLVGGLKDE
ncbi:forkhead domain protein [Aspergillus arachidicola]|uniref:Forkhead domain protein n=1 Tax=Aspergillus arachidicola TaxID=656916 RepID=A0A2G7FHZ8_9EURO|nr:forkhead domain protein [Aspergillus arachidicola]